MARRTLFTTISPLPTGISRAIVLDFLHNHLEMIDLNPLAKERHPIEAPLHAHADEVNCVWYSLTDRITYFPGASRDFSYSCAFHDLPTGIQTHCRAPLNVDIREKWTLNGILPREPVQPVELGIGAPAVGPYIREDVDLRCNVLVTGFVKKQLKKLHATLVDRPVKRDKVAAVGERPGRSSSSTRASAAPPPAGQTPGSRPPQLGSPFIVGYQPSIAHQNHQEEEEEEEEDG